MSRPAADGQGPGLRSFAELDRHAGVGQGEERHDDELTQGMEGGFHAFERGNAFARGVGQLAQRGGGALRGRRRTAPAGGSSRPALP